MYKNVYAFRDSQNSATFLKLFQTNLYYLVLIVA